MGRQIEYRMIWLLMRDLRKLYGLHGGGSRRLNRGFGTDPVGR